MGINFVSNVWIYSAIQVAYTAVGTHLKARRIWFVDAILSTWLSRLLHGATGIPLFCTKCAFIMSTGTSFSVSSSGTHANRGYAGFCARIYYHFIEGKSEFRLEECGVEILVKYNVNKYKKYICEPETINYEWLVSLGWIMQIFFSKWNGFNWKVGEVRRWPMVGKIARD